MRFLLALLLMLGLATPSAAGERGPVVVELFTSQGCSSCPPADAFLGELAKRPDVLALSLHVDYWDYIGWKDPFAQARFTARQRDYGRTLVQRYVYTPQMIVDGRLQGIGSERGTIERLIAQADRLRAAEANPPVLRIDGDTLRIEGGNFAGDSSAAVWLAVFETAHRTGVKRGENAGRNLANFNVVREWRELGRYSGKPATLALGLADTLPAGRGAAVVVQGHTAAGPGPVLAALTVGPR